MNVWEQQSFDQLAEENHQQRETIRELIRERVANDKYWTSFVLKVLKEQSGVE
jgi:hypothetical protein